MTAPEFLVTPASVTIEGWQFDQGRERLSGTQIAFEVGYRF